MFLQKVICRKTFLFYLFFGGALKVNDENSRIRIHKSEARILASGSTPKCHGSATLLVGLHQPYPEAICICYHTGI
jgi:hypothetical protein